jgi:hypothetical protein
MPRSGGGIYSKPAGTTAVPNTVIESSKYNSTIDDIVTDLNAARPISAGGTGSTTAADARTALGISATNTPFTPTGAIAATNVQTALAELDTEKALLAGSAAQVFSVAAASANDHAVSRSFGDGRYRAIAYQTSNSSYLSNSVAGAFGNNIMQNTEGAEYLTLVITPRATSNRLIISAVVHCCPSTSSSVQIGLFQDSTAAALTQSNNSIGIADALIPVVLSHEMAAGTTSATTFRIRGAANSGSFVLNGISGGARGGGRLISRLTIIEVPA